jgi:hypothetical protein
MTGPGFTPGAEHLTPSSGGGTTIDFPDAGPHVIQHTTEAPSGGGFFDAMHKVLINKAAEPTHLCDPLTDRLGQYFPAPQTGRAVQNDGAKRTNRVGTPCLQVEWVAHAARPFTRHWKPGPNIAALGAFFDDWGIPHEWPSGPPPVFPGGEQNRSSANYFNKGGHYAHAQVPGNDHGDPGQLSVAEFFRGLYGTGQGETDRFHPGWSGSVVWPAWFAYPGKEHLAWGEGRTSTGNLLVQAALIAKGQGDAFVSGHIDKTWTTEAQTALDDFKASVDMTGAGITQSTWQHLGTMPTNAPDFHGSDPFTVGKSSQASLTMQALLILQGFTSPLHDQATTRWGPGAHTACRQFQLSEDRLKVDPDGVPGLLTWQLAWTDND